ncbi:hypothetical protein [Paracoccus sp. S1E-3]|uniref:hypothetical protein n=1 Tax=Paracoccus sp. S1E-3 TaxID=2756130 RepID=UPI0015EF8F17|nr:hypothetical protein [Paracoccus sp. S1E-3]MBA4490001.1 hypothetical protein [Paracoccus sp. S1E-3]
MNKTRKPDGKTAAGREDRLGAALRANLARRKAQARARADQDEQQEGAPAQDSAPESEE